MISIDGRWWSFPGAQIDLDSEFEWRGDGRLYLHDGVGNVFEGLEVDNPEERRRREVLLARLMILITDHILAGDPLAQETVRDLIREVRHCYPELVDEYDLTD
jgi:hypothetical protein